MTAYCCTFYKTKIVNFKTDEYFYNAELLGSRRGSGPINGIPSLGGMCFTTPRRGGAGDGGFLLIFRRAVVADRATFAAGYAGDAACG